MQIVNHKIGESFYLLVEDASVITYKVIRSSDGKYFNRERQLFEVRTPGDDTQYLFPLFPSEIQGVKVSRVNYIPKIQQDLVFEFSSDTGVVYRERHLFGGMYDESNPNLCIVYGTLYDPSGRPMPNVRVEASLNRNGYFIDKVAIMGPVASAVTDDRGYFEMPLIQGINVTITVSSLAFSTTGYVPTSPSVKLSGYCLLKEGYGRK